LHILQKKSYNKAKLLDFNTLKHINIMYKPTFGITNNLLTYISRIESAKSIIDNAALVPAWEAKFRDDALSRTVHFGTKIEGNELTQEQTQQVVRLNNYVDSKDVIKKTGIIARDRDIQEVINYRNVSFWIDQQDFVNSSNLFKEKTLKTLHSLTMQKLIDEKYIGSYRDRQVVVKSATNGQVVFRPPISVEIEYLIRDFFEWLASTKASSVHPIFRAAITHYQLVYIHPFIEGNGRTARAMATLVMKALGYDFKRFFSIEQYFDSDVEQYYQALLSVQQHQDHDLSYWLEYFCYGLAIEIDKIRSQVEKLSKDIKLKRELGSQVALSERQIILLEVLQNQGSMTSQDAQRVLPNISVDTILRDLKDLIAKGVVKKSGVTKGVNYTLNE
jgi:Fic family protein